jgi:2-polyprenyl-6-methoxyphenol hydroxylase-like FAD-dependent oxidoreductase
VCYKADDGWHEVRAALTVGADGPFSRLRHLAGFEPLQTSATLELLQFRLPHLPDEPGESQLLHENSDAPLVGVTAADFRRPVFPLFGRGQIVMCRIERTTGSCGKSFQRANTSKSEMLAWNRCVAASWNSNRDSQNMSST